MTRAVLCLLLFAASPGRSSQGRAPFHPGEAFTFKFSLGPVESGRARMSVGRPTVVSGRRLVAVQGQAETSPWLKLLARLDDRYHLLMDATSLLPVTVTTIERGMRERRVDARLDGRRASLDVVAKTSSGHRERVLPSVVRDPLSGFFMLRAAPLRDGDRITQDVLDGTVLWRVTLTAHRGERVRLEADGEHARSRPAIRVEGRAQRIDDAGRPTGAPPRRLAVWLSDDAHRVLLRLEADTDLGRCALELTAYIPPKA